MGEPRNARRPWLFFPLASLGGADFLTLPRANPDDTAAERRSILASRNALAINVILKAAMASPPQIARASCTSSPIASAAVGNLSVQPVTALTRFSDWKHRRHPRQAACGSGWAEEGRRYRRAQRLRPTVLVEAGGMVERGPLEALRECMMSGVTVPPWRSRVYLANGKVGNKSVMSSHAPGGKAPPASSAPCRAHRCGPSC